MGFDQWSTIYTAVLVCKDAGILAAAGMGSLVGRMAAGISKGAEWECERAGLVHGMYDGDTSSQYRSDCRMGSLESESRWKAEGRAAEVCFGREEGCTRGC